MGNYIDTIYHTIYQCAILAFPTTDKLRHNFRAFVIKTRKNTDIHRHFCNTMHQKYVNIWSVSMNSYDILAETDIDMAKRFIIDEYVSQFFAEQYASANANAP